MKPSIIWWCCEPIFAGKKNKRSRVLKTSWQHWWWALQLPLFTKLSKSLEFWSQQVLHNLICHPVLKFSVHPNFPGCYRAIDYAWYEPSSCTNTVLDRAHLSITQSVVSYTSYLLAILFLTVFSACGLFVTKLRNQMGDETLNNLVMLRAHFRREEEQEVKGP